MSSLEPRSSRPVVVHRVRAREPWVIGAVLALLVPTLVIAVVTGFQPLLGLMLLFGFGSWVGLVPILLTLYLWKRSTQLDADKTPRNARASQRGLFVDGGPALPRATVVSAFVSPSWPNGAYVKVFRRGGFPVELWTADIEGAHALVAGLGLDEKRVVGITRGASWVGTAWGRLGLGALAVAAGALIVARAPLLAPLIVVLALVYATLGLTGRQYVVGSDGVLVRWLGRRVAFTPIAEIASVEQHPGLVRLQLRDGSARDLVIARRIGDRAASIGMEVSALAERIRGAMRRSGTLEVDSSALERGERDVSAWIASLRDLARGSGYRAAVQREDLVFLVEDARTRPGLRIAAAIALGTSDEHERARVRIAAESSSLPEVADALDAVLAGEDEPLEGALRRLEGGAVAHRGSDPSH